MYFFSFCRLSLGEVWPSPPPRWGPSCGSSESSVRSRGQQRGDAAVQNGKTRDFTTKLESFFTFVKTWIITTRIYILVSVSRFPPLFFSTGPWCFNASVCECPPIFRVIWTANSLRTLYDMAINCTWLSYRRGRVMCIDLEPVPMLKSGDKDCVSQSGSGVGTLIAVM